jgi:hypothetical protein
MRRDVGPLRRPIERSDARHMTSGRKSPVWPGRRLSSTELGCTLGSCTGAQVMRKKSPGSHPGAGLVLPREIGDDGCHDQRAVVGVPLGDHISRERYRTALGRLLPGHLRLRRIVIPPRCWPGTDAAQEEMDLSGRAETTAGPGRGPRAGGTDGARGRAHLGCHCASGRDLDGQQPGTFSGMMAEDGSASPRYCRCWLAMDR